MNRIPLIDKSGYIRRFADDGLAASIDRVLEQVPEDHIGAVLEVTGDASGVEAVAAVRLEGGWSLMGGIGRYDGEWKGQVKVRWSGK